jgi:16S rRNA processing protein RimM
LQLINKSNCRFIGVLAKLHGYKGEFLLVSDVFLDEEITNWESVFFEIEGLLVPFFIESLKITSDTSALVCFAGINSPDEAREFISCKVFQLTSLTENTENYNEFNELSGYTVIDQKAGVIGEIDRIVDYNQNFLFRVLKKKREILIPVNEKIIVKVNHKRKEVLIAAPEGLLEL